MRGVVTRTARAALGAALGNAAGLPWFGQIVLAVCAIAGWDYDWCAEERK